jgi:hypothetical protein
MNIKTKHAIAKAIETFMYDTGLCQDTRIYFSNKCYNYDSNGKKTIIKNIVGSDYCQFSNDETITMTFEGPLCDVINYEFGRANQKWYAFLQSIEDKYGYYTEMGYHWSLTFYEV